MEYLSGCPVILTRSLVRVEWVRRTWKERLFSLPWHPLQRTRPVEHPLDTVIRFVSMGRVYFAVHPQTFDRLRRLLAMG